MHGRLKVRTSEEEKIQKEKERAKKVVKYNAGMTVIIDKRSKQEYDNDGLELTAQILMNNPDIYTLWNYRREIILFLVKSGSADDASKLYDTELYLTEACLKINPKSYSAWYQRIWVLDSRIDPDWNTELKLCNKYLKMDERNFHCWDYRRHVVSKLGTEDENEFKFSSDKIMENFSNYSAWHYRSKLLTKLFPDPEGVRTIEETNHRDELELVLNAAFTDPNDTSAWFYQRWLLGAMKQPENLAVARMSSEYSYISFNQPVSCPILKINVEIDGKCVNGEWTSLSGQLKDVMWILKYNSKVQLGSDSIGKVMLDGSDGVIELACNFCNGELIGSHKAAFPNIFGSSVIEELEKQVENCEQLLELEPDSKWTYLTLAVIKHSLDSIANHDGCIEIMKQLTQLDLKRENYYKDLMSRWHIEYILQTNNDITKTGRFTIGSTLIKLSTIYHLQYWSNCVEVFLNDQELINQCLPKLYVLQNCNVLHLENNQIDSLRGFPVLPKLKTINLRGNKIQEQDLKYLSNCPELTEIIYDK